MKSSRKAVATDMWQVHQKILRCFVIAVTCATSLAANRTPARPAKGVSPGAESPKHVSPRKPSKSSEHRRNSDFSVGLELGSNAVYGNALTVRYDLIRFVELRSGLGWNMSGLKAGAGAAFNLPLGAQYGVLAGGGIVRSMGNSDKVRLPAKFTPEAASSPEEVTAIRKYTISPATYGSVIVGGYLNYAEIVRFSLEVNWNKVVAGNTVQFSGNTEFDQPIEVSNETELQSQFDLAAKKKLDTNGAGVSVGMHVRI